MKTIIIKGKFLNSDNNWLTLEVYASNSSENPYDFKRTYTKSFTETLVGLADNSTYDIDFAGYTAGTLEITISGGFNPTSPIEEKITATGFTRGYTIETN